MIYLLIWLIYFIQSYREVFIKNSKKLLGLLFLVMTVVTAIRSNMGTDYSNYFTLFSTLNHPTSGPDFEIGFKYLVVFFKKIGISPVGLFSVFAVISFVFLKKGIEKNSYLPVFSLLIYYSIYMIPFNFNAMGQGIVIGIYFYCLDKMRNKETLKLVLITVVATLIHISGLFIFVSYVIYRLKLSRRYLLGLTIFSGFIILVSTHLNTLLIEILPGFIASSFESYMYLFNENYRITSILQRLIIIIIFFIFGYRKNDPHTNGLLSVYIFGFFLYALFSANRLFATRINLGFKVLEVVILPNILSMVQRRENRAVMFLMISLLTLLILISNFGNPGIYPYKHIWSQITP